MNKILRFAFVAAFAAVSSLSFAQKTVTFEAAKTQGPAKGENISLTVDGVTLTISEGAMDNKFSYRVYQNRSLTISSGNSKMIKIEMECDDFKEKKTHKQFLADGFVQNIEGVTISADKIHVTWIGDVNSVEFKTLSHQVRVKKITVTLKSDPTGIKEVNNGTVNENAPIYNLAGQRVGKDYKGVVIQNGKKFIKK
ncbi:hypothetical protein [Prevotella sp.]|uniref:hypothetical protein n=1 Tax=Prevotella sp. TaxID=59823 RepID=UPI001CAB7E75|nr:hypothetical protein [Prevotella sp.]MBF1597153.1 hypothetical protein [Prevotella sp.]